MRILGIYLDIEFEQTKLHTFVQSKRKECPLNEFCEIVDDFLTVFGNSSRNLRLIFLIDEIEESLGNQWTETFFNQLRSLIHENLLKDYIRFVIAGSSQIIEVREKGSPLLNILNIKYLEALEKKDILKIINLANEIPIDVAEAVLEQCGGHPFIAQYLMYHLWEYGISKATVATVAKLANRFMSEQYTDLMTWQLEIGKAGQLVYKFLAEANDWLTVVQVRQLVNTPELVIQRWLTTLCYHGLAIHDDSWSSYRVEGKLFKGWFKDNILPLLNTIEASSLTSTSKPSRTSAFISYSHRDSRFLEEFRVHLVHYIRTENLDVWDDTKIAPSAQWHKEIQEALQRAKVAVLLVSGEFLASEFIATVELPQLITAAEQDGTVILYVILRPCAFMGKLAQFQSVNSHSSPLAPMSPTRRAEVWIKLAELVKANLDENKK